LKYGKCIFVLWSYRAGVASEDAGHCASLRPVCALERDGWRWGV